MNSNPVPTGLSDAFDFYIDSVRFIPDNSSMIDQLDAKKQGGKAPADNLPLSHCVRYRVKMGLNAKVEQVYGLPGESSQTWLD